MSEITEPRFWIAIAEEDMATAQSALCRKKPALRTACFHAQQCAEKYLKAVLVSRKQKFPKTHDLSNLSNLCRQGGVFFEMDGVRLDRLSIYAAQVRYPGLVLGRDDAKEAIATARAVRRLARKLLGVK